MNGRGFITISMHELERVKIIEAVVQHRLTGVLAAERLQLCERQVSRLVRRYEAAGPAGLVSARRGQPSNRELPVDVRARAMALVRERYADFGPTLACEKLRECHGVMLAKETVRRWMREAGLWIPRKQRPPKLHQPRNRRACLGELVQIDGSDHRWFEDRAPACTLLVFIDDATGRLMALHFTATESTFSYFEAMRAYLEQHGKPVALYSDKASVFHCNSHSATPGKGVTQFGRALYELNVDTFCANSSQAKGRVERANLTLQDRLVKELRLRGITTKEAANAYAPHFIADFNGRFGKMPRSTFDAHRPLRADDDLDLILTVRVPRRVSKVLTVQYDRVIYLLEDTVANRRLIHRYLDVFEYPDGRIEIRVNGAALPCVPYDRLSEIDQAAVVDNKRLGHTLQLAQVIQAQRDDRRASGSPSRTNQGEAPRSKERKVGTRKQRELTRAQLNEAILGTAGMRVGSVLKSPLT
ncbi:transposase [Paraburkholderia sp. MM5496-R1]|uniref:Integrase core domain-containing protein n=1 Tax=Paraburkholderia tuberum TaxID=157910 RepID=A0A1H1KLM8_9BURK|nr:ISNCY family transposase [Paraburkholderia tuberum]SDR63017.1 Integrase core domain-containing protein [Paraburkholderia tuberum]